jgi:hypothetical protein
MRTAAPKPSSPVKTARLLAGPGKFFWFWTYLPTLPSKPGHILFETFYFYLWPPNQPLKVSTYVLILLGWSLTSNTQTLILFARRLRILERLVPTYHPFHSTLSHQILNTCTLLISFLITFSSILNTQYSILNTLRLILITAHSILNTMSPILTQYFFNFVN